MTNTTATSTSTAASTTATFAGRRTHRTLTIVVAGASLLAVTGCSGLVERATEQIVEEGVERAVEADTGDDVDVDFDSDGSFSIETEGGSISSGSDEESWALWPAEIDRPDYVAEGTVAGSQFDDGGVWLTATGIADGEPTDAISDYVAELDGFEEVAADPAAGHAGDSIFQVTVVTG